MGDKQLFNIFDILSTADKELVHSAMFKFFIQSEYLSESFFSFLEFPSSFRGVTELEKCFSFIDENRNKRKLRFDLLVSEKSNKEKTLLVIENKFKATPTVSQLALYDCYFSSNYLSQVKKVLFVFSIEQVILEVKEYCKINNWTIKSYLPSIMSRNVTDEPKSSSILEWLNSEMFNSALDSKSQILLNDYHEYLKCHKNRIEDLVKNKIFHIYNNVERFTYFQYLLYIQKRIAEELYSKGFDNIDVTHDGGKNIIPSIAFWMPINNSDLTGLNSAYVGIDGSTFKLGVSYDKSKHIEVSKHVEFIKSNLNTSFGTLKYRPNNRQIKKSSEDKKSESVNSIHTFEILENQLLDLVIHDIVNSSIVYFNKLSNAISI